MIRGDLQQNEKKISLQFNIDAIELKFIRKILIKDSHSQILIRNSEKLYLLILGVFFCYIELCFKF